MPLSQAETPAGGTAGLHNQTSASSMVYTQSNMALWHMVVRDGSRTFRPWSQTDFNRFTWQGRWFLHSVVWSINTYICSIVLHGSDFVHAAAGFTIQVRSIGLYSYSMVASIQLASKKAHSGTDHIQCKGCSRPCLGGLLGSLWVYLSGEFLQPNSPTPSAERSPSRTTKLTGDCRIGSVLLFILPYGQRTVTKLCSKEEDYGRRMVGSQCHSRRAMVQGIQPFLVTCRPHYSLLCQHGLLTHL